MTKSIVSAVTFAPLVVAALAGCSSDPGPPQLRPGELSAGTAKVSIDGRQALASESVTCSPAGAQTAITTGGNDSGTAATIDTSDGLVPLSVEVRNVDGFSGSFWHGLDDEPDVTLTGRTYLIEGTAMGYSDQNPTERVAEKFSIQVAC
jgi:ipoprotein LpqH